MSKLNMNAEIRDKWVDALRSGKYHQCTDLLRENESGNFFNGQRFCCLGVLADVVGLWEEFDEDTLDYRSTYNQLNDNQLFYGGESELMHGDALKLAELNDQGKTFEFIADYIDGVITENGDEL